MPKNKDLKRLARARMKKTGESYTTARAQLLAKKKNPGVPPADYAKVAGVSDDAVKKATGCPWKRWVKALDSIGASTMKHKDIAKYVHEKFDVSGWWAQAVTVGYERIRGLREKGQRRGGGFDVNKSKTIAVPIHELYRAFARAPARRRWLGDRELTVRKSNVDKSIRFRWEDGTPVEAYFWSRGPAKSRVQLQHRELPSRAAADRVRAFWTERFAALHELLTRPG